MIRIERFEAVEVAVPNGSTLTRFQFPDIPQLRNAKISAIQVYTAGSITATPLTGSTPVTTADLKKSFLTLYQGDLQLIYSLPLISLNNMVTGATPDPYTFELPAINGLTISWTKSYISLPSALATTNVAYSFGVYYNF
jgi:hypothetical protein